MRCSLPVAWVLLLSACGDGEPLLPANAVLPDGAHYRGEIVNGLLQGAGRLDYANGSWFRGQFKDGQADGPGEWHGATGEHYVGTFKQGLFDGQGRLTLADGSRYEGEFHLGLREGEGELAQPGQRYSGEFRANLFHGFGRLQRTDGSGFQGRFKQGEPDGEGVRIDADGGQWSGRFSAGRLEGPGAYLGPDGDHYSGSFHRDRFSGRGRYSSADGAVWSGTFKRGALSGPGELHDTDGSIYRGHFDEWEFSGAGALTLADGTELRGEWRRGQRVKDASGRRLADPLELALLDQGQLLRQALEAVPSSTPAVELYSLSVAGDGSQGVFQREADYVSRLLSERFASRGQISLVNQREHLAERPLATRENIARALQTLADKSGPEDVLFIFFTSHGSPGHQLALQQPRLQLADLSASELAELMTPLRERYKVLVISACYSGGFVAPLQDARTLVITASRADRVSFGCSDDADFTYFGRALFAEALQQTDVLDKAYQLALAAIARREADEGFEPSEPQMSMAPAVLAQWQKLRSATVADHALAAAHAAPELERR